MSKKNRFYVYILLMILSFGFLHCGTDTNPSEQNPAEQASKVETGSQQDAATTQDISHPVETVAQQDTSGQQDTGSLPDAGHQQDTVNPQEQGGQVDTGPVVPETNPETTSPDVRGSTHAPPFEKGAGVLFIGHSFFIPPSTAYNAIAKYAEHKSRFPNHVYASEFAGGAKGAPGALWKNAQRKASILKKINTGKVDVLAMTAHLTDSDQKDYQNWIDVALKANKKTSFLISCPWPLGGSRQTAAQFAQQNDTLADTLFKVIVSLRKANPGLKIHYLNHGVVAVIAKRLFSQKTLKSTKKACCSTDSLFRDTFGHGGDIIVKTAGFFFLSYLTGFTALSPKVFPSLNRDEMVSIVKEALKYNQTKGYFPK